LCDVVETLRPLTLSPLAGLPPFVRGLSIVRGAAIPVIDACRLLAQPETIASRWVTLRLGKRRAALAVQQVLGTGILDPADTGDLPPLLAPAGAETLRAVGALDGELLALLETSRCVPDPVWEALARVARA
jgi:purine-binding chemotaxis protein CheW